MSEGIWTMTEAEFSRALAKAWSDGFKQGGPMHDEYYGEPDKHTINPYEPSA